MQIKIQLPVIQYFEQTKVNFNLVSVKKQESTSYREKSCA